MMCAGHYAANLLWGYFLDRGLGREDKEKSKLIAQKAGYTHLKANLDGAISLKQVRSG